MLDLDNIFNYYGAVQILAIKSQLAEKNMRLARKAEHGFFILVKVAGGCETVWATN